MQLRSETRQKEWLDQLDKLFLFLINFNRKLILSLKAFSKNIRNLFIMEL